MLPSSAGGERIYQRGNVFAIIFFRFHAFPVSDKAKNQSGDKRVSAELAPTKKKAGTDACNLRMLINQTCSCGTISLACAANFATIERVSLFGTRQFCRQRVYGLPVYPYFIVQMRPG
ncbi:hypothetical protein ACNKHW_11450 [Shigella flexneri]